MALFFNIEVLESETKCDATKLVTCLYLYYAKKSIPKTVNSTKPIKNLHGLSFLLNPKSFFKDRLTDISFKAQYIRLAGRRSITDYTQYNYKHLDLSYFPDLDLNAIKHNPLLKITDNKIYFKYEEL